MSTIVCQGLDSCLESNLLDSRTLRLKLSSPKLHISQSLESAMKSKLKEKKFHFDEICTKPISPNPEFSFWSLFLQAPKDALMEKKEEVAVYVHPLAQRSLSALSEKSLEMCTENLGNETGTDVIEDGIFSAPRKSPAREQQKSRQTLTTFPPPLTTMRGSSESLQLRPQREDGKLIIKAVKVAESSTRFQAERSHGRLRLWVLKNEPEGDIEEESESDAIEEEEEEERREMGVEKIEKGRRCREEGESEKEGLWKWEVLWVAKVFFWISIIKFHSF